MTINRFMSSWVWEEQEKKKKLRQVSFGTCIESPHVLNTHTQWHTSRRSQSVRPRRRVFEEAAAAEVHPLRGPRARRKLTNTHSIQEGNHSRIRSDCTFYWQRLTGSEAAEEVPRPPPPHRDTHSALAGHDQLWIYLVHADKRTEGRIHTRIESKKK